MVNSSSSQRMVVSQRAFWCWHFSESISLIESQLNIPIHTLTMIPSHFRGRKRSNPKRRELQIHRKVGWGPKLQDIVSPDTVSYESLTNWMYQLLSMDPASNYSMIPPKQLISMKPSKSLRSNGVLGKRKELGLIIRTEASRNGIIGG